MATLRFNGTSNFVIGSGQGAMNGAITVAALMHMTSDAGVRTMVSTGAASTGWEFGIHGNDKPFVFNDNVGNTTGGSGSTQVMGDDITNWYIIVFTRGTGETPRFHTLNFTGAGSWTHELGDPVQTTDADSASGGEVRVGAFNVVGVGVFDYFPGDIALVGWWEGVEMSDGQVEALDGGATTDWHGHAAGTPSSLTEFRSTTPTDLEGLVSWTVTGATAAGSDTPGWTFDGVGSPPVSAVTLTIVV